jgi:hypothetical protein
MKQRIDVSKYSFVNRTIKDWNCLPAGELASFPCKINTFRRSQRSGYRQRGFKWGLNGSK